MMPTIYVIAAYRIALHLLEYPTSEMAETR